jgi:hypothetical protein
MEQPLVTYTSTILKLPYINYVVVEVPPQILEQLPSVPGRESFKERLIIRLDGKPSWQCGILAMGEGSGCITVNAARLKEIGKGEGDEVTVELFSDTSEFGVEVAEEVIEYWAQDEEAYRRFLLLKPSMQRYILNHVLAAKTTEKRLERTVSQFRNLVQLAEGKETYREVLKGPGA